jgi:hypothetical protein
VAVSAPHLSEGFRTAIERACNALTRIHLRLGFIESIHAALVETAREKDFHPANLPLYGAILGEREMIAIELASWARGFYADGGLLDCVSEADLDALGPNWSGPNVPGLSEDEAPTSHRSKAFAYLFPYARADKPTLDDVSFLCWRLHREFKPLRQDRNHLRAHKHEPNPKRGNAKAVGVEGLRAHLQICERLVQSVRYLASDTWWKVVPETMKADRQEARDVVDLILLGTLRSMTAFAPLRGPESRSSDPPIADLDYESKRKAFYAELHAAHEGRIARGDTRRAFNDAAALVEDRSQSQR